MPSGRTGALAIAPQAAAYDETGGTSLADFITALSGWKWLKATQVGLGVQQMQDVFPPEVGGGIMPSGAYKGGYFGGGDFNVIPRLEDSLGYILYALCGSVAVTADYPEAGMYHHEFTLDTDDESQTGLLAARTLIPASADADLLGETFVDCVVPRLSLALPQTGLLTAAISLVGRQTYNHDTADVATWTPSYASEQFESAALASRGAFEFPEGSKRKVLGATIDFANGFTSPDDERYVGSYVPDNYQLLGRAIQISFPYKWSDPTMYKSVFYSSNDWTPTVYTSSFLWEAKSPANISGMAHPYKIAMRAAKVSWLVQPMALDPNRILTLQFSGNVLEADSGPDFRIILENKVASYSA